MKVFFVHMFFPTNFGGCRAFGEVRRSASLPSTSRMALGRIRNSKTPPNFVPKNVATEPQKSP